MQPKENTAQQEKNVLVNIHHIGDIPKYVRLFEPGYNDRCVKVSAVFAKTITYESMVAQINSGTQQLLIKQVQFEMMEGNWEKTMPRLDMVFHTANIFGEAYIVTMPMELQEGQVQKQIRVEETIFKNMYLKTGTTFRFWLQPHDKVQFSVTGFCEK